MHKLLNQFDVMLLSTKAEIVLINKTYESNFHMMTSVAHDLNASRLLEHCVKNFV